MATNQDFNNLIVRVDAATDTLETNVITLTQAGSEVAGQLILAQAAATTAQQGATNATTQAGIASTQATTATTQATKAETEALKAANSVIQANQAVTDAKALAPFQEAPKDGSVYGRKDGTWSVVTGGGGSGTVVSVNGISPNALGNVEVPIPQPIPQVKSDWNAVSGDAQILNKPTLFNGTYAALTGKPTLFSGSYTDLTNKPILFSGSYTDLTSKPTIPTNTNQLTNGSGFIADAPNDGKQYARKSLAWSEVESSGGGGFNLITPYLANTRAYADATTTTPSDLVFNTLAELATIVGLTSFTPYTAIPLNFIYRAVSSPTFSRTDIKKYNNIFKAGGTKLGLSLIPSGLYSVGVGDFVTPVPFAGKEGLLKIEYDQLNPKRSQATFYEFTTSPVGNPNVANNKIYLWMPTISASANEGMWAVVTATNIVP